MDNDLAYLIAIGHKSYHQAAELAIQSLRRFGGFRGHVLLLA